MDRDHGKIRTAIVASLAARIRKWSMNDGRRAWLSVPLIELQALHSALSALPMLDPKMPVEELRLHLGELTAKELRVARAAIALANARIRIVMEEETDDHDV